MSLRGRVKNGVIVFDSPANLPEGAEVDVLVLPTGDDVPTLYERLKDVIGSVDDLPADASTNHDHYLYGTPKK